MSISVLLDYQNRVYYLKKNGKCSNGVNSHDLGGQCMLPLREIHRLRTINRKSLMFSQVVWNHLHAFENCNYMLRQVVALKIFSIFNNFFIAH